MKEHCLEEGNKVVSRISLAAGLTALLAAPAFGGTIVTFSGAGGLGAEAEFDLTDGGSTLNIRFRNTSTGVPDGFSNSDQILTSLSWDFGGLTSITAGTAEIGADSMSLNFDTGDYGPGTDVGGEWGYGNGGTTGLYPNFITANQSGATIMGGPNLDGPAVLNGPQGGLVADPLPLDLGGLGAIQTEILVSLSLSDALSDLSFLGDGTTIEFGSDAMFIDGVVPTPGALALLALAGLAGGRRRR
jgi:MYXO-CTERM domain-containing protein